MIQGLLASVLALATAAAIDPTRDVGFDQRLGAGVPQEVELVDEDGKTVRLGDLLGRRPALLALVYYKCPMLCTQVLEGLVRCLKVLSFDAGDQFEVVVASIDPRETPAFAAAKKEECIRRYGRPATAAGWHFLTGEERSVHALAEAIGFRYRYDPKTDQYAHASGIVVLTPQGRISRHFYGIEYAPRDVRLALVEAAGGKIGSPVDQILLLCLQWDPSTGKYGLVILSVLRIACLATVGGLSALLYFLFRGGRARPTRPGIG